MVGPTHPLVGVIDLKEATRMPSHFTVNYGVYALYLKDTKCGNIRYGRQTYDYDEGTVGEFCTGTDCHRRDAGRCHALGQGHTVPSRPDTGHIAGTGHPKVLFSSPILLPRLCTCPMTKRTSFWTCLAKLKAELQRPIDKYTRKAAGPYHRAVA